MTRDEILSKAKPILFNTEMVRAILEGRKTVTRRVNKLNPVECLSKQVNGVCKIVDDKNDGFYLPEDYVKVRSPYQVGDILYVRETFRTRTHGGDYSKGTFWAEIEYRAGGTNKVLSNLSVNAEKWMLRKWRSSRYMPKQAARIFLRVKDISVERVQNITDDDIIAEGLEIGCFFDDLWDSTIKPKDRDLYGWKANPWVWVIEFERIDNYEF